MLLEGQKLGKPCLGIFGFECHQILELGPGVGRTEMIYI